MADSIDVFLNMIYLPWFIGVEVRLSLRINIIYCFHAGKVLDHTAAIVDNGLNDVGHIGSVDTLDLRLLHGHDCESIA